MKLKKVKPEVKVKLKVKVKVNIKVNKQSESESVRGNARKTGGKIFKLSILSQSRSQSTEMSWEYLKRGKVPE